ncbi:ABC transporter permease [Rhizomonospora bruguierae]|uniref:ABC transporter permease n=1 Tax=Rhizomonospora bruguierae TaxID=1581705 RepID=UPI001BCD42B9|nr:ABC transporter permease [Micromonospora sp. NBRC 107566]
MSSAVTEIKTAPAGVEPTVDPNVVRAAIALRRRTMAKRIVMGVFTPIFFLAIWEVLSRVGVLDREYIPPPSEVFRGMGAGIKDGSLTEAVAHNGWISIQRLVPGFALGLVVGLVAGIAMGILDLVRFGLRPIISATFPIPKIAIFPILIIIFGIGDTSKIVVVALAVFYMVCINTASGIEYSNRIYREVATAFQVPKRVEYLRVIIPSALPSIMTGVRLGVGNALIVLVSAEFVSAQAGIGYYIWNAWQVLDINAMFGGLIVIALFGILTNWCLLALERRLIPWSQS